MNDSLALNVTPSTSVESTTTFMTNITSKIHQNSTDDETFEIPRIFNIFEDYPWLLWVFIVVISLIVIGIVIIFCYCIIHNKKKVIRQGSDQAIFDYDQPGSGCLPCNRSRTKTEQSQFARQNSASNMSPYGRSQPLPPIRNPRPGTSPHPVTLGIHISSVKGIPDISVPPESRRPLPPIRPKTT